MATRPSPNIQRPERCYGSIEAAAERLGCSPRTVRRMIAAGEIAGFRLGKRLLRVDLAELDSIMRRIPTAGDGALSRGRYGTVQAESARVQNRTRAPDVERLTGVCPPKANVEAAAG